MRMYAGKNIGGVSLGVSGQVPEGAPTTAAQEQSNLKIAWIWIIASVIGLVIFPPLGAGILIFGLPALVFSNEIRKSRARAAKSDPAAEKLASAPAAVTPDEPKAPVGRVFTVRAAPAIWILPVAWFGSLILLGVVSAISDPTAQVLSMIAAPVYLVGWIAWLIVTWRFLAARRHARVTTRRVDGSRLTNREYRAAVRETRRPGSEYR